MIFITPEAKNHRFTPPSHVKYRSFLKRWGDYTLFFHKNQVKNESLSTNQVPFVCFEKSTSLTRNLRSIEIKQYPIKTTC